MPTFFLKVETSGKVAKSAGELSNIQRQDIKDARKGAVRYKLAEDESHSSEGGGGINQARKTNAYMKRILHFKNITFNSFIIGSKLTFIRSSGR